ncbi:hypothetical protein NW762_012649 [Fusarium torreyae]|uniref:Dihydroxyacetone kinase n=1 Tax=Fusarium torreyae TaxID=1237075 RepID=A0A9W8RPY3_9HYPO|nr:hypothetical protein NW762_012649 [Fusarium torreyae]
MSDRHIFNSADGLVDKSLRGLITYNPSLGLDPVNRVVFDARYDKSKVSIISGGGSGHEPAWSGYVGSNMLTASVAGDIFASPSTSQILAAIEAVPSDAGTLLVVTNYTGDCLHFGLANEKALRLGHRCRMIICGDDVAVGRTHGRLVGRRGLAGQISVLKVLGGAAGESAGSLDDLYDLGTAFSQQIVSIAATLDHCHVPGRGDHGQLDSNEVEIGTGPHNEPGYKKLSPTPSSNSLVQQLLSYLLDQNDAERAFAQFDSADEVVLLVNNFGGISYLEIGALVEEVLRQLHRDWSVQPVRVFTGVLESSLNAPAFTLSLINITAASRACSFSTDQIRKFLDAKTDTHWESMAGSQSGQASRQVRTTAVPPPVKSKMENGTHQATRVDMALMRRMVLAACNAVIEAEPDLTRWDTVMGDGDCGETLKTGALNIIDRLCSPDIADCGSVLEVLEEVEAVVERKMGGTLGGILDIFLVALTNGVRNEAASGRASSVASIWGPALSSAITHLGVYTKARVGDRTVMDVLIPFSESMASGDFDHAVSAAVKGAETTKSLRPKLGRATYVAAGVDENSELPPDPGAWGVMVAIRGLQSGFRGD